MSWEDGSDHVRLCLESIMKTTLGKLVIIACLLCLAFGVIVGLFGRVDGEEFCPQKFTVQRFHYYQIPVAKIPLTPVTLSKSSRGNMLLSSHLRANKLLGAAGKPLRWDIVHLGDISSSANTGDAEILLKYLEQPGAFGAETWLAWTKNKQHREVVELFWPLIGTLADEQLYILMPDVFDWARAATAPSEFSKRVHTDLPAAIRRLAKAEQTRGNTKRADHLEDVALQVAVLRPVSIPDKAYKDPEDEQKKVEVQAEGNPEDFDIAP